MEIIRYLPQTGPIAVVIKPYIPCINPNPVGNLTSSRSVMVTTGMEAILQPREIPINPAAITLPEIIEKIIRHTQEWFCNSIQNVSIPCRLANSKLIEIAPQAAICFSIYHRICFKRLLSVQENIQKLVKVVSLVNLKRKPPRVSIFLTLAVHHASHSMKRAIWKLLLASRKAGIAGVNISF